MGRFLVKLLQLEGHVLVDAMMKQAPLLQEEQEHKCLVSVLGNGICRAVTLIASACLAAAGVLCHTEAALRGTIELPACIPFYMIEVLFHAFLLARSSMRSPAGLLFLSYYVLSE